jgi:S-methylmethionine-dependent homocysteine/selenocysteine methylase
MSRYRQHLPQLQSRLFLTDGGLETTLIYHEHVELPLFAAFELLNSSAGVDVLRRYFSTYAEIAYRCGVGIVLETPTWREPSTTASRSERSRERLRTWSLR